MHSIRMKITAMTIAAILTSLLTFIVIGFFTLGKENERKRSELGRKNESAEPERKKDSRRTSQQP